MLGEFIVPDESVDFGFDEDESVFRVLVSFIFLDVFSDGDGSFHEGVQVLGDLRSESLLLEHAEDFGSGDESRLGDGEVVSEDDSDLGRLVTFLGQGLNLSNDLVGVDVQPSGGFVLVRD